MYKKCKVYFTDDTLEVLCGDTFSYVLHDSYIVIVVKGYFSVTAPSVRDVVYPKDKVRKVELMN